MIDDKTGIDFPFFQSQLTDLFGDPTDPAFERDYLRIIDLTAYASSLSHVRDYSGSPWKFRVYGNYVLEDPLIRAFDLIVSRGLAYQLKTYDGCFNVRRMKSSGSLSVHSWGLALDFNQATNPFTGGPLITDFTAEFVKCFAEAGFEWGGLWASIKDAMHFQLPWSRDWRLSQHPLRPVPWVAGYES